MTKEQTEYVNYLENWIEGFKLSNIHKLINACDEVSGIIADDITLLAKSGNDDEIDGKLLMLGSKKNKIYEQYISLVKELKHFKTIDDLLNDIKPKLQSENEEDKKVVAEEKPIRRNISDLALSKKNEA